VFGLWNWPVVAEALAEMRYDGSIRLSAYDTDDPEAALEAFPTIFTL
jgi:hydroxypyruvate isomerase